MVNPNVKALDFVDNYASILSLVFLKKYLNTYTYVYIYIYIYVGHTIQGRPSTNMKVSLYTYASQLAYKSKLIG